MIKLKVETKGQCIGGLYRKALVYMWVIGLTALVMLINYDYISTISGLPEYILLFILALGLRLLSLGKKIEKLECYKNAKR